MNCLITSDLHLSDRPRDQYRFPIFKWLAQQQQKYDVSATYILGDLTDRKDNHSAKLVNQIIDELLLLRPPVYILRGNHDGLDPSNPFFRFLQTIEGLDFVVDAKCVAPGIALIPHQPDQASFDRVCSMIPPNPAMVATHQCFDGAMAETGSRLTGFSAPVVRSKRPLRWYSGDVHTPQVLNCGPTYVGAPYHIRFGDQFDPRVLLIRDSGETDLHFPCLRKWILRFQGTQWRGATGPRRGDHVKIIVTLSPEEVVEWAAVKRRILDTCREMEVQVFGCDMEIIGSKNGQQDAGPQLVHGKTNAEVFTAFCKHEKVAENIKEVGAEFVRH